MRDRVTLRDKSWQEERRPTFVDRSGRNAEEALVRCSAPLLNCRVDHGTLVAVSALAKSSLAGSYGGFMEFRTRTIGRVAIGACGPVALTLASATPARADVSDAIPATNCIHSM